MKYGEAAFSFEIAELCERDILNELEKDYIELCSYSGGLYNMTKGGEGLLGVKMSEETKGLIRAKNLHRIVLLNTREIFESYGDAATRYGLSESALSLACYGKIKSAGRNNGRGLAWATYEDYVTMTEIDIALRIKQAQAGLKYDTKEIVLVNTGEHFPSIINASTSYNINKTGISACCRHKKSHCGKIGEEYLVWMFAMEYDKLSVKQIQDVLSCGQKTYARKVVLLNTGEVFRSVSDAAEAYRVGHTAVRSSCDKTRKSGGSFNGAKLAWAYEEDYRKMTRDEIKSIISDAQSTRTCAGKHVMLLNTGETFESISRASAAYNLQRRGITKCCDELTTSYGMSSNNEPLRWAYC